MVFRTQSVRAALVWALIGLTSVVAYETGIGRVFGDIHAPAAVPDARIIGFADVVDGDTLKIDGRRIRLFGIDAPERDQTCRDRTGREYPCGRRAEAALAGKIGTAVVSCDEKDIDQYGRIVAVCYSTGEDLNGWMAGEGFGMAYRRYTTRYAWAESQAKAARRGIWAGSFVPPEAWRR